MDPTGSTTVLKMDLVCRTCLNESDNMKPIFMADSDDICKMLQSCSGLSIHAMDGFPTNICADCLKKAHISYDFRQQCEISHNALVNFMGAKINGSLDSEIENGSHGETIQPDTKLVNDFELYKCSLCPNQYTTLVQLNEHFMSDHLDKTFDNNPTHGNVLVINGNANEVSAGDNSLSANDIKPHCPEEKYIIYSEPDVSAINFKEDHDDQVHNDQVHNDQVHNDQDEADPDDADDYHQSDEESGNESDNSYGNGMVTYDDEEDDDRISDDTSDKKDAHRKIKSIDEGNKQDDPTNCSLCNITFEKKSKYYQHMESQHKEVKLHQCDRCDKKFSRITHLRRHQVTHLAVKPYPCEQCDKRFSRLDHRNIHMRAHSYVKPYKCEECDKAFTRPAHLRRHRENRHDVPVEKPAPSKTEICEICQKAFTTPKYLQIHMKVHRAVKEWTCKFCQEKFNSKQDHNEHQKVHVNERPFLCSECGLRFVRNDYLVIHMRRHKGEKPYKCKFCGKGFPRATDLTVHERYHTGEKTHLCTICGKGFQRAYNLLVHTRVHTGERPYKCPHCDKSFAQGNDLKAHVRRHTGERFKCDICGDGFIQGYHLTQHKRNQHGIDMKSHIRRVEKFITPMAQQQRVLEQQQMAQEQLTNPATPMQHTLSTENLQDTKSNIPKLTLIPEYELRHQDIITVSSSSPQLHPKHHQQILNSPQQITNNMHMLGVNETIVKMEQIDEINQISTIMNYPN